MRNDRNDSLTVIPGLVGKRWTEWHRRICVPLWTGGQCGPYEIYGVRHFPGKVKVAALAAKDALYATWVAAINLLAIGISAFFDGCGTAKDAATVTFRTVRRVSVEKWTALRATKDRGTGKAKDAADTFLAWTCRQALKARRKLRGKK